MPSMMATHFDNTWGGEMWGRWATAWRTEAGGPGEKYFSISEDEGGSCVPRYLFDENHLTPEQQQRDFPFWPTIGHSGHQGNFMARGYWLAAEKDSDPPFEIPAMGLGLFTCRREAWLGFNPNFRGFGGEEWYIHEKFRQAGAKCLCLPFLKWWHYFAYCGVPPYARHLTHWNKVRNYVIGHTELGLPLDRLRKEFAGSVPEFEWDILMRNPANPPEHPLGRKP
jgi:hypothetical protein